MEARDRRRIQGEAIRLVVFVALCFWFVIGTFGFLIAVFHPAQEDRVVMAAGFGFGAVLGGAGLWFWGLVSRIQRNLRGKDQA